MPKESPGRIIAKARQRRRISQAQLAEALGVSPSTVANWERGSAYPLRKRALVEDYLHIVIPDPDKAAS